MDGWMEAHSANIMCRCFFLNGLLQLLASCNTITQWIVLRTGQDCFVLFVCVLPPWLVNLPLFFLANNKQHSVTCSFFYSNISSCRDRFVFMNMSTRANHCQSVANLVRLSISFQLSGGYHTSLTGTLPVLFDQLMRDWEGFRYNSLPFGSCYLPEGQVCCLHG
jgi:hypothetical protein